MIKVVIIDLVILNRLGLKAHEGGQQIWKMGNFISFNN